MSAEPSIAWLENASKLSTFSAKRCTQLSHNDWRQLSELLQQTNKLCSSVNKDDTHRETPVPLVYALEVLLRLGEVTSWLLSLNGDEPTFSVARVAQAIRTTTMVLDTVEACADGTDLPHEVADALARQRCEQTHLLSAMAWALRQEARALFFNPRPTALSLSTALLDLFRVITRTWPDELFIPLLPSAAHDPSAGRLADPAAQLASALLRCAGRAVAEVGPAASKELMIAGLRVGYELMQQINSLMFDINLDLLPADQPHVKQLMQSPSVLHLMVTMLAVQTQRLQDHLGIGQQDSYTVQMVQQHKQQQKAAAADVNMQDQQQRQQQWNDVGNHDSSSKRRRMLEQEEDDDDHAGPGDLHQLWTQVLEMGKKAAAAAAAAAAAQADSQQQQAEAPPASPLLRLWAALGLPDAMLPMAAAAAQVFTGAATSDYIIACRVARFLLQGSSHLQPPKEPVGISRSPPGGLVGAGSGEIISPMFRDLRSDQYARSPGSPRFDRDLSPQTSDPDHRGRAASPTTETAALLVDSCRDYGLRGLEELEVLQLQRLAPLLLLDTAATLCSHHSSSKSVPASDHSNHHQLGRSEDNRIPPATAVPLELINVSCCAAASSARCWPVLERVTSVQWASWSGLEDSAPAGVFPRLTALYWQQYESASEDHIPVQELLQLVCCLIEELLGPEPDQSLQQQQQQQQDLGMMPDGHHKGACSVQQQQQQQWGHSPFAAAAKERPMQNGHAEQLKHPAGNSQDAPTASAQQVQGPRPGTVPLISPRAREALVALIEVLTSVSKLPWEQNSSSDGSAQQQQRHEPHWHYVLSAWQAMCQPVAAAVEHILRRAGAAAIEYAAAVAAAAAAAEKQQQGLQHGLRVRSAFAAKGEFTTVYPTIVALGSCLAVMLSPLGRPGPLLVAAGSAAASSASAAAAAAGAPTQLFALLVSEIKVLLSETSVKRELLAMHALEQAPLYMLKQIRRQLQHPEQHAAAPLVAVDPQHAHTAFAVVVPWLLLLSRLLMLRGQLLADLLDRDVSTHPVDERSQFSMLHNAFWNIQMAEASAGMLEAYLQQINNCCQLRTNQRQQVHATAGPDNGQHMQTGTAAAGGAGNTATVDADKWHQLALNLRQALHLCKAAMKLARHYHETGFASGFAAGFAAGYAAAVAAGQATNNTASDVTALNFSSPLGVLHHPQIRNLPQQLKSLGGMLAGKLAMTSVCSNPSCLNLSMSSELLLVNAYDVETANGQAVCARCGLVYCSDECRSVHKGLHKRACKRRSKSGSLDLPRIGEVTSVAR